MCHYSCVKHCHQNALFCLNQPFKRYLVHIARPSVFLGKKPKDLCQTIKQFKYYRLLWTQNFVKRNNCDKHLPALERMIHLCSIILIPSLLIPFDGFIWYWLNQCFCETEPQFHISSNRSHLLIKKQCTVISAAHAGCFLKRT